MSNCKKNQKCAKADCHFLHPVNKCILWDRCRVAGCGSRHSICDLVLREGYCHFFPDCGLNHPPQCLSNDRCKDKACTFLHISAKCSNWMTCSKTGCNLRHGFQRRSSQQNPLVDIPVVGLSRGTVPVKQQTITTKCSRDAQCWASNCNLVHSVPKCSMWDTCTSLECRRRLRHAKQDRCDDAATLGYCPNKATCCKLHATPCNSPQSCWNKDCKYLHDVAMCEDWNICTTKGCKLRHGKKERCQEALELGHCSSLPNCAKSHTKKSCANITKCWHKECPLLHSVAMCTDWDNCVTNGCEKRHGKKEWCPAGAEQAYCPDLPNCTKPHKPLCEMDVKCWHADCKLLHTAPRCAHWSDCATDGCKRRHAKKEWCQAAIDLGFCAELPNCPKSHKAACESDEKCWRAECKLLHSVGRCAQWQNCTTADCSLRHAKPKVAVEPCAEVTELGYCPNHGACKKWHPPACINNRNCWTPHCPRLHRVAKCAAWFTCTDAECKQRLRHGKSSLPAKPAGVKRAYSSPRAALLRQHNAAATAVTFADRGGGGGGGGGGDDASVDSESASYFSAASSRSSLSTVSLPSAVAGMGLSPVKVPVPSKRCSDYNKCSVFECAKVNYY